MRPAFRPVLVVLAAFALGLPAAQPVAAQCVSLTTIGVASTQNFDTLSSVAASTTNNLTITGWFMTETGGGARDNEQYAVDTGGSGTGDTYSLGAAASTERAFGGLQSGTLIPVIGACFTNNTGATITSLDIAYIGEQWRIGNTAAARDDRIDFQFSTNATSLTTGTWTDDNPLDFTNLVKTAAAAAALNGNDPANRTAISSTIGSLSIANGATFWIRWNDLNATGADDDLAVDDFSLTPQGGGPPPPPTLNISDVTLAEGDPPGTTTFTFAVTLTAPAGPGGVTFDIATADGTAQDDNPAVSEDNDYVAQSLTGQSIPMGSLGPYNFNVTVNRDTTSEPNETFFVDVANITGASNTSDQGQGTINNDDVTLTPIHDIQGPGGSSPLSGSVTTTGIVTGRKSNGYFIQDPNVDADPMTSEGIFVFTSSAPPAAAAVGNLVQVTGTIAEFVPAADLLQPPLTELTSPTTVQLSTGNPLPLPIPLNATFPDPAGPFDQLERLEGMRVSVASLTVSGPTLGNSVNEANATQTSNGVFFGVVTGVARPFREPGIQAPDPAPSGSIPPIPRFDANPEMIRVDSDGLTSAPILDVATGAVVTGLVGPLDYTFRHYTLLPDPTLPAPVAAGGLAPTSATVPTSREFTVGAYNMERFFDAVNDPGIGEPVLTPTAFDIRLNKASLGIRNNMRLPDILGVVEVENLSTLQALAARISADAIAALQPDPMYSAHLVEGNDIGGIDVGFLVKTAVVFGSTPRVTVNAVVQENAGELMTNPDSSTSLLNDRPSLRLDAVVNHANGATFPVTVIVNHLRSLIDVNSIEPGSSGFATAGERVRAKRQKQAESLANLVQVRQTNNPAERIILVGDFNAYEFNDGLADTMEVIAGTPPPDNQTAVPGDGIDLVNPDLDNLFDTPAAPERYSYVFDGQAQNIDHELVNAALITATVSRRVEHPRINTDFPAVDRNDPTTARHLSDHDPILGFFEVAGFATADLAITKTDGVTTATPGGSVTYTITASNAGPDPVTGATVADTFPAILTCTWTCVGAGGGTCTAAGSGNISDTVNLPVGASVTYTASCTINASATGTLANTATVSSSVSDPNPANNSATDTDTLTPQADLVVTKTDSPDPVTAGTNLTYTITVTNNGPSNAASVSLSDTLPAGTTFNSLSGPGGWSCTTPGIGAGGTVSCSASSLDVGNSVFTLTVAVGSGVAPGTILSNTATVSSTTADPNPGNENGIATTTVGASADLAITKTDGVTTATAGGSVTYTITASNAGPSNATGATVADTFPASLTCTWTCVGAGGGTCTAAGAGNINDTVNLPAGGSVTYTASCTISAAATGSLSNTATVAAPAGVTDPNPANNSATDIDGLGATADLSITKTDGVTTAAPGDTVTYTIVASNAGPSSVTGATVADTFPAFMTCTWTCVGAGGGTCTAAGSGDINDTVNLPAGGSVTYTASCTIPAPPPGPPAPPSFSNTATVTVPGGVTDPNPGNNSATDTDTLGPAPGASVSGTKTASGTFEVGSTVTYTIVLTNNGPAAQPDNPGFEFTDTLPATVTLVSADDGGNPGTFANAGNTVNWNGSIPASGGTVTITITATINPGTEGQTISNQGTINFDGDGNGTNESTAQTDDPAGQGSGDPTNFVVGGEDPGGFDPAIPTLDTLGLVLLAVLLALGGAWVMRRRRTS